MTISPAAAAATTTSLLDVAPVIPVVVLQDADKPCRWPGPSSRAGCRSSS